MTRQIKIRVNPEQSAIIQRICFENGVYWVDGKKVISNVSVPYLFISSTNLYCVDSGSVFKDSSLIEIDVDTFIKETYKPKDIALDPYNVTIKMDSTMFDRLNKGEDVNIKLTLDADSVIEVKPVKGDIKIWRAKTKLVQISQYGTVNKSDDHHNTFTSNPGFNDKSYAVMVANEVYRLKAMYSWLEENDDGWKPDWNDADQAKFFVAYSDNSTPEGIIYCVQQNFSTKNLTGVYMSENNADKLCRLLNDGLVKLTCQD